MKGRPSYKITGEICLKAESLAAQGLTMEQIAHVLGICRATLHDKANKYPDFSDAIKRGQAKGIAQITNKLFQKAKDGDNTAMIFYLKNRDPQNWKDVHRQEHSGPEGSAIENKWTVEFLNASPEIKP